jgi:predicted site-specific integrase-resolvase
MSGTELTQIIDARLTLLKMTVTDAAKDWITELSRGLPYYTHSLGLHAAHSAIRDDRVNIEMGDVAEATHKTVTQAHTIHAAYNRAVSSPQKQNLYEQVLLACAMASTDDLGYFSAAAVSRPMSAIMGKRYYVQSFARHLSDFCTSERGPILHRTGEERKYRYRFADPMMEPFVTIHGYSTGRLNSTITRRAYGLEELVLEG